MNKLKSICGVDTLYYFCESNENYDDLFLDILDQIQTQIGKFDKKDMQFQNSDINIILEKDYIFKYTGKSQGFYWLNDFRDYFKIGFKDTKLNQGLNDIQVQLTANGIYTLGIKSLLEYINNNFLKDYITDYFPITRIDINCFVNYDFSFLTKDMFVTRKRNYTTVSEIGSATKTQTIYVGKKPFLLRIYDKNEELKKSKKKHLMNEYFLNNGLDINEPIYNIEFELHRTYLKQLNLSTIDNVLNNVNTLFTILCDEIRMIDLDSISSKTKKTNKYKAKTHSIWEELKNNYNFNQFHQESLPIQRIKRIISIYDDNKFELEYISLIRKAVINKLNIDDDYIYQLYIKAKDSLKPKSNEIDTKSLYTDIIVEHKNKPFEKLRYLKDEKTIIKPVSVISLNTLSDYDLQVHYEKLLKQKDKPNFNKDVLYIAKKEMIQRNLINDDSINLFTPIQDS